MNKEFGFLFEKGIRTLCTYMAAEDTLSKPTLFHSIRVGVYLYNNHYPEDIIIGGLMHDILEDTAITETELTKLFSQEITNIVKANSKDKTIADQNERIKELISRCTKTGENALIVKAADILDNFDYFKQVESSKGLDYCIKNAQALLQNLPASFQNPIFNYLQQELNKTYPNL